MTDNEIIKALEHCASDCSRVACKGCPFDEKRICMENENALAIYALDLINRQKAEIKRLENKLFDANQSIEFYKANFMAKCEEIDKAKSETIKKFAKKLKAEKFTHKNFGELVAVEEIDNLVKEMVGEGK